MKKTILLLLIISARLISQTINENWVKTNYTKKEYLIKMRDGAKLFTTVYAPKDTLTNSVTVHEKHPILMLRTPYSCAPYGEDKIQPRLYNYHWKEYLKEGYIMVFQDVRGRWMSEGEFMDVRPFNANKKTKTDVDEASDTYDAVDWLVKNIPNNNGNVGFHGISYPGFYAAQAGLSNHPAIKAISPQAPVTEWFMGDDFHHNGAFMLFDAFNFYSEFGQPRPKPTTIGPVDFKYYTNDKFQFYLETGALSNFSKLMGDSIKFWTELMNHPNYDTWWQARDARNGYRNKTNTPAMLIVGGLFDAEDCYGAWKLYDAVKQHKNTHLVMGPWYHGGWTKSDGSFLGNVMFESKTAEYYQKNIEIPFFNFYLKSKGNISTINKTNIFYTGQNKWDKDYSNFLVGTTSSNTKLYFTNDNALSFTPSTKSKTEFDEYTSNPLKPVPYTDGQILNRTREYMTDDQRFASKRTDVLTYTLPTLQNNVTIAGTLTVNLNVAISTTDADFIVKIIDVFPNDYNYDTIKYGKGNEANYNMNGYQMLVRGEVMRGRYRNSFKKPEAFEPNKITTVKFELPAIAHTFKKGHKIMLQVQSSWFPLVDRNPQQFIDIYHCNDNDFIKSDIKLYHSLNQSYIELPILTNGNN